LEHVCPLHVLPGDVIPVRARQMANELALALPLLTRGLVSEAEAIFQDPGFRVNVVVIAGVLGHVSRGREYCG
jgi:hypothetical protein